MYDLNDNPIAAGQIAVTGFGYGAFSVRVDCRTGFVLRAGGGDMLVEARRLDVGDGDVEWTNLITGAIDLGAWNGSRETFEVRISGTPVAARTLREARLIVEENV